MANVRVEDVISSLEKFLAANWPTSSWRFYPTAADAASADDRTDAVEWVGLQWLPMSPARPMRASEDWVNVEFRLICYSRSNDRLAAAEMATQFKDLLRSTTFAVYDRATGGTTQVGSCRLLEVSVIPPAPDSRGVNRAVVEVTGWGIPS